MLEMESDPIHRYGGFIMLDTGPSCNEGDDGPRQSSEQLLALLYDELRRLAAGKMSQEAVNHTWQATELVHEAYLRLVDQTQPPEWNHRGHFFAAAAEAMRRILVDHARSKGALKRGADRTFVPLSDDAAPSPAPTVDLLELDEAITALAEHRADLAELVNLRYFAGLSMEEVALAQQVSTANCRTQLDLRQSLATAITRRTVTVLANPTAVGVES